MRRLITAISLLLMTLSASAQDLPTDPNATLLAEFGRGEVKSVGWSPDGESVWVGTSAGTWELDAELNERRAFPDIRYGALSPDGTWLAGYSETGFYALYDLHLDRLVYNLYGWGYKPPINRPPLWSPNGQWVAYRSSRIVSVLNITEPDLHDAQVSMYGAYQPLVWSESGRFLAGYDGEDVWVMDTQNSSLVKLPTNNGLQNNYANSLVWFNDEELHWVARGDGGDFSRWRWDGEQFVLGGERSGCGLCLYSPDGRLALQDTYGLGVRLLSTETQETVFERAAQVPEGFVLNWRMSEIWSLDSQYILGSIYLNNQRSPPYYGVAQFDATTGEVGWLTEVFRQQPDFAVLDGTGKRVLVTAGGVLAVLDGQTGEVLARNSDFAHLQRMALDDDGTRLALSDGEGRVKIAALTEQPAMTAQQQFLGYTHDLSWQPGSDSLLVSNSITDGHPQAIHLFNTNIDEPAEVLFRPSELEPLAVSAVWKPDGSQIAIADRERVYLVQPDGLEEIYEATPSPNSGGQPSYIVGLVWNESDELPTAELYSCCSASYYWVYTGIDPSLTPTPYPTHDPEVEAQLPFWTYTNLGAPLNLLSPRRGYALVPDAHDRHSGTIWRDDETPLHFLHDVEYIVWMEDESRLAMTRLDGSLWVLSLADNQLSHVWTPPLSEQRVNNVYEDRPKRLTDDTTALVWSADSMTLAYNYGGVVRVWRLGE